MKLTIDTDRQLLTVDDCQAIPLYSREAFELLSQQWVRVGWSQRYSYTFSWFGRPIIQLPEDLIRIQEVLYQVQPDVIVETGIAHGGSLVYYASLLKAMGKGRVIGIDVHIRPHNREAIAHHPLASLITLIEGDSIAPDVVSQVRNQIQPGDRVLVILDSCHTKAHVAAELEAYCTLVTPGSYLVATDGIMGELSDVPGGQPDWKENNPTQAAIEFADRHPDFTLEVPPHRFNESFLSEKITYWPGAWLRRC